MKLFFDHSGPLVTYDHGILQIEDLNPSNKITWRVSRVEMWRLGWRCIVASLRRSRDPFSAEYAGCGSLSDGKVSGKGLFPNN
jgi:hypothetical protein